MKRILLPISLDRWRSPIASLLRNCAAFNTKDIFYSFSNPQTEEDKQFSNIFWSLKHVTKCSQLGALFRRYDIVHIASLSKKNLLAVKWMKRLSMQRIKFLCTLNLEQNKEQDERIYQLFEEAIDLADGVVAVSDAVIEPIRKRVGEKFLGVIPNGYDPNYFNPKVNYELPKNLGGKMNFEGKFILYLSALEPRKHPEIVVELAERMSDVTFVAAGFTVPGLGEKFEGAFRSTSNIVWLGHVERVEVRFLLKQATAMIFPSEREGLPLSVIESLGMGLPVIAQPQSSMPELIVDRENGRLIDIEKIDEWENAIRNYLDLTDNELESLRKKNYTNTVQRYSWESVAKSYGEIYDRLLKG